jgi:hypothetical protein
MVWSDRFLPKVPSFKVSWNILAVEEANDKKEFNYSCFAQEYQNAWIQSTKNAVIMRHRRRNNDLNIGLRIEII